VRDAAAVVSVAAPLDIPPDTERLLPGAPAVVELDSPLDPVSLVAAVLPPAAADSGLTEAGSPPAGYSGQATNSSSDSSAPPSLVSSRGAHCHPRRQQSRAVLASVCVLSWRAFELVAAAADDVACFGDLVARLLEAGLAVQSWRLEVCDCMAGWVRGTGDGAGGGQYARRALREAAGLRDRYSWEPATDHDGAENRDGHWLLDNTHKPARQSWL
jgi:hypothetical protein